MSIPTQATGLRPVPPEQPAQLTRNARTVIEKRYLIKDGSGSPTEQPETMFWRVATTVAEADRRYGASASAVDAMAREFYALMTERRFEPNSPTLMNAGRPLGQLSACFVLPVEDALSNGQNGIYDTLRSMALIHQSGGGTGFSFSRLRGKGSMVRSTTGVASGPVSFMKLYDASTDAVKQGGCVVPDTLVSTNRGVVPIRELGPAAAPADSWHPHAAPLRVATDAGEQASDEFYVHGVAAVRRIRTRSGYHLAATHRHQIRVIDAEGRYVWRRFDELAVGDWVVLQKGHLLEPDDVSLPALATPPHPNATAVRLPAAASELFGEFVGYLVGDGAFNRYNSGGGTWRVILSVADAQPDVAAWLERTCETLFGVRPLAAKKPGDGSTNYFLNATMIGNWLAQIGVSKPSAADARVPDVVFRNGPAFARGFLRGLFTADGTASREGYPSLSSVSPALIDGVQQLLLGVGVPSAISVVTNRESAFGDRALYRLRVTTRAGLEVFAHTIGFLDAFRVSLLPAALDGAWERNDVIPNQGTTLRAVYAGPGRGSGVGRGSRGADRALYRDVQHYLPGVAQPRQLTRSRLGVLAEKHAAIRNSEALTWFLAHDQFYDQIEGIEEGESLTLDLSVPVNNTYVANGFVSHNTRRGANMGILRVDHPDILDFIACKEDLTQITNFNISVAVTDSFMDAVNKGSEYDLLDPASGAVTGRLDARMVWDRMIEGAWRTGEPGCFFIDEANRYNPVPHVGQYEATNPCGEQPILPYDVCNLGSINVGLYVRDGVMDWDAMRRDVHLATHFLDNIIDINRYPLPEIDALSKRIRRIGFGVMGFADALVRLGVPYDSPEGIEFGRTLQEFVDAESKRESERLANERGPFPEWARSIWGPDETCARDEQGQRIRPKQMLRNCNVTTVAPTGTISIIAGCSSGIEPLFAVAFMRNQAGVMMPDVNEDFVSIAKREGWYSDALVERIAREGHIHFDEVPQKWQRVFVTAHDITPEWHVRMQAAFQEHCDSAISKCIAAGTLVPTDKGLIAVEAFAAEHAPDTFAAPYDEYRTGGHRVLSHYRAGTKAATRIRLDNGAELVGATESHRVMTPDGWRLMSELVPGDLVAGRLQESHGPGGAALHWEDDYRTCANRLATPKRMTPGFARFLGMLAADGHTHEPTGCVGLTCKNEHVEQEFRRICREVFGADPNETVDRRNGVKNLYLTSRNLVRFVDSLIGHGAYAKHAPEPILRGSYEEKLNFLEGVTLDGYATPQGLVLYGGMSKTLAYHVAELARSFGMPWVAQGRKWVEASGAFAYDVVVANELQEIVTPIEPHKRAAAVYKRYKVLADVMSVERSQFRARTREYYALRTAQNQERRHVFNTTAALLGLSDDTLIHEVTAVEPAGEVELYDVEVESAHEYVVNGMVSHNTTNFPHAATRDDVRAIYELAYDLKCKGVTVYRDGSRDNQVLSTGATEQARAGRDGSGDVRREVGELQGEIAELNSEVERLRNVLFDVEAENLQRRAKRARPDKLRGTSIRKETPLGTMFVHITEDDLGQPFEVFINLGKAGGAAMADAEAVGRLISLALRSGIPMREVHRQLRGISSDRAVGLGPNKVLSVPDAIGIALEDWLRGKQGVQQDLLGGQAAGEASPGMASGSAPAAPQRAAIVQGDAGAASPQLGFDAYTGGAGFMQTCPDCSSQLEFAEGCAKCHVCGFSECG